MLATICKLAAAATLLITRSTRATKPPIDTTLFDEVILQHGHRILGSLQVVNFMSYEQVEVALSMLFFHNYLNPKQENPLNEAVFQRALLDILYKLWLESKSSKPSSTSALSKSAFANCHLMRYLRIPLLKIDTGYFEYGLKKYQKVHVSKAIRRINPELHNTENGNLFIDSLIELLPAMTVGYGLLMGDSNYWKHAKDARMARIFIFAFLNLDFAAVEEYVSADNALNFLCYSGMVSSDMVIVWPRLFEVSQYKDLGEVTLSKEEAEGSNQDCERITHMKRRQQLYKKLTGEDASYGSQLTTVPFRALSLICKQPLMLKKATMIQGPVYKNMSCLLQAGNPDSRADSFRENILTHLREIAKLESLMSEEHFTVSSLFIRHTKEFLFDRSFVLSQDFHALPLKAQNILLSETRPNGVQPDDDTPTSIIASVQSLSDYFRYACKQDFTATELESADKLNWFVLDVVCPGLRDRNVLLQYNEHPELLSDKDGTKSIILEHQYYQALWGANKSSPNNCQYVSIVDIDKSNTTLCAELLMIPTDDTNDASQRKALLKVDGPVFFRIAAIWWDPESRFVKLQKMFSENIVCQVTIPQHVILDVCPEGYGLEHRMIVVLSRDNLPTLEEAAQMLTMKDRQLHDMKDQRHSGNWTIITVKPKCLASVEYAPDFPLSRPNRLLAVASDFSDLQDFSRVPRAGKGFTPSKFLVRIGKELLHSVLMTSQHSHEMSKAAWLAALEDLKAYPVALLTEEIEQGSTQTIRSYLSEHHWTWSQLITGKYEVASLPAAVRFLWHQHRVLIAIMLGCIQDALNWDTSLATDLMVLSTSDLWKNTYKNLWSDLIAFFEQGFWATASPEKKQEWLQMMQYVHPHIGSYFCGDEFMPKEELPSTSLSVVQENIVPAVSDGVLAHEQFVVHVKSIVGSEQAKARGFIDFVPILGSGNQFRISSNQSGLYYAILDRDCPSKWSIYEPDDMTLHEINNSQVLIAHHCHDTLEKLLLNYASYMQRGIVAFVLLNEHFLTYKLPQLPDLDN